MGLLDFLGPKKDEDDDLFIEERDGEKILRAGKTLYSKVKKNQLYTNEYWDYFLPSAFVYDNPKILMIGLGGGTIAFQLATLMGAKMELDAIEISRKMTDMSQDFMPRAARGFNVIIGDGAEYIDETNKRYDVIFLDAYMHHQIPEQFRERKFVIGAHRALADNGILAVNFAVGMMGYVKFSAYVGRLKEKFTVFRVNTAPTESNVILLCSKSMGRSEILKRISANMKRDKENEFLFANYETMTQL